MKKKIWEKTIKEAKKILEKGERRRLENKKKTKKGFENAGNNSEKTKKFLEMLEKRRLDGK